MADTVKADGVTTVKRGKEHDTAQKIRKIEEITEVLVNYGLYDMGVRIEAKSLGHLDKIFTDVWQMTGIQHTSTLLGAQ